MAAVFMFLAKQAISGFTQTCVILGLSIIKGIAKALLPSIVTRLLVFDDDDDDEKTSGDAAASSSDNTRRRTRNVHSIQAISARFNRYISVGFWFLLGVFAAVYIGYAIKNFVNGMWQAHKTFTSDQKIETDCLIHDLNEAYHPHCRESRERLQRKQSYIISGWNQMRTHTHICGPAPCFDFVYGLSSITINNLTTMATFIVCTLVFINIAMRLGSKWVDFVEQRIPPPVTTTTNPVVDTHDKACKK